MGLEQSKRSGQCLSIRYSLSAISGPTPRCAVQRTATQSATFGWPRTNRGRTSIPGNSGSLTEWHTVVLYRKLAEIAERYLKKGARIYIEGRVRYRKWQDKNGIERTSTEIEASSMTMLDSKGGSASQAKDGRGPTILRGEAPVSFGSSGREPAFPDDGIPF